MFRSALICLLIVLAIAGTCLAEPSNKPANLIPVRAPEAESPSAVAEEQQPSLDPNAAVKPSPSEQMYVFWLVGKMLSYPVDTMEAYVRDFMKRSQPKVVPASAGPDNPFENRDWSQIPPTPPVTGKRR